MPVELDSSHSFAQHLAALLAQVPDPDLKALVEGNLTDIVAMGANPTPDARRRIAEAIEDLAVSQVRAAHGQEQS